jgi:predicted membrane channel-forming protein YqfA (hemolysin III family)
MTTKPRPPLDLCFLLLGALSLCAGTGLGIAMGLMGDFGLRPVHAHANLLGWASLALFGLFYRAYPDVAASRLSCLHLLASGTSGVLFPIGLWLELQQLDHFLLSVASAVWAVGTIIFLVVVACSFARARRT